MPRVQVVWKHEGEDENGPYGPVWIETYSDDPNAFPQEEKWDEWVSRSKAVEYARANGYEFFADE
ncbi:MAG TPA: hypothetical protein VHG69_01745 [Thermoleophilaceae bacterium]|nr:hypothetical protein [Thermoleophilaceae bacterium]